MVEFFKKEDWDKILKQALNYNFYQSYSYYLYESLKNKDVHLFVEYNNNMQPIVAGFCYITDEFVKMEHGPLVFEQTTDKDYFNFLNILYKNYNKPIIFTIQSEITFLNEYINKFELYFKFCTLVLDLQESEQEFLKNCNENRQRIIKKVKDKDFIIEYGNHNFEEFYGIYCQRMETTGGQDCIVKKNNLIKLLQVEGADLICCKKDNIIYSGMIAFSCLDKFETRYNTNRTEYLKENAGTFLDYKLITKYINDKTIKHYDFAGFTEESDGKPKNVNYYKYTYGGKIKENYFLIYKGEL